MKEEPDCKKKWVLTWLKKPLKILYLVSVKIVAVLKLTVTCLYKIKKLNVFIKKEEKVD